MLMNKENSGKSFWIVFALLLLIAGVATYKNLSDYQGQDKLNSEGKRVMLPIDSIDAKGSKREIFVQFSVNNKKYLTFKKVKTELVIGDTVPVYYLPESPEVNGIAVE